METKGRTAEAKSQVLSLAALKTFGRYSLQWRLLHLYLLAISLLLFAGGFLWFRSHHVLAGNTDFTIYYTALQIVRNYSFSHLYDLEIQSVVQREILDGSLLAGGLLPFNHPPFEVLLFLPLEILGFRWALLCWLFATLALVFLLPKGLQWLLPGLSGRTLTLRLSALSFYPFLVCLWQGQDFHCLSLVPDHIPRTP